MNNSTASRKLFLRKFARDDLRLADNAPLSKILNELNMTEAEFYPAMERLVQFRKNELALKNSKTLMKKEQQKEKRRVAYQKRVAKKKDVANKVLGVYTVTDDNRGFLFLYNTLANYKGKNILVKSVPVDTSVASEIQTYSLPSNSKEFNHYVKDLWEKHYDFRKNSEDDQLKRGDSLVVMQGYAINGDAGQQSFADGPTNCMLTPIKQWAKDKLNEAKGKSSRERYVTLGNKIEDLLKTYSTGVPQDKIKEICNKLNICITVSLPFQKNPYICERPDTKTLTTFKFLNPRHNHVEEIIDLKNEIIVTPVKLGEIIEECQRTGTDYYYTKNNRHINVVYTQGAVYRLSHTYADFIQEFEIEYNIASWKIDALKNPELTRFLTNSCHYNCCMDLNVDTSRNPLRGALVKHIDQEKCYKNFHTCEFYDGFLTRITDFRVTDKIQSTGIYQITDICITNEQFKRYNDFLHLYENMNSYPSPALHFLETVGTFKILGGCWGMTDDLNMNFTSLQMSTFTDTDEKVPFYSKYFGACNSIAYEKSYYLRGTEATAQIIRGNVDCEVKRFTTPIDDKDPTQLLPIRVRSKKHKVMHLSHVTAFILEYARLNIIEQLMNMKFEQILRVNSDGIYFQGETPELCNNYRVKPSDCFNQDTGKFTTYSDTDRFTSSTFFADDNLAPYEFGACRSFFRTELAVGGGGSGKTHFNLMDKGQVNPMYVAPTWKLARNKQEEYGCSVGTHASLLNFDPTNNPFANASVLIIDEVSMMTDEEKTQIIKYYHSHKLIFCGDINHQIPYVTSFKPPKSTVFNMDGLDNIMEFASDYRAKCEKLRDLKELIRDMIDCHVRTPPAELLRKFNSIAETDLVKQYTVHDMVLCCSNKRKDEFRDLLKGNKYYITKTTNKYSCGDIIITDEDIPKEFFPERRHAFTVHSIQGETCRTNLYISPEIMDMRMFYTAVSRAQTHDQIFIIRD